MRTTIQRPKSVPLVRQQEVDWRALSDHEQQAVRDYSTGMAPITILPERAKVYVERHHPVVRES